MLGIASNLGNIHEEGGLAASVLPLLTKVGTHCGAQVSSNPTNTPASDPLPAHAPSPHI